MCVCTCVSLSEDAFIKLAINSWQPLSLKSASDHIVITFIMKTSRSQDDHSAVCCWADRSRQEDTCSPLLASRVPPSGLL